ncbi:MAG: hypothetical protein J6T52_02720 [Bacteroidaceae bacterium]|nr:hypothetical protein [Bacteroidaceae bacterium]
MEQNRSSMFAKTDDELIRILARWWKMSEDELMKPFQVIASFRKAEKKDKNGREFGYFIDVRNLNGDILYYPMPKKYGRVSIFSMCKERFLSSEFLQINVKLAPRSQREKFDNPFMLTLDNWDIDTPNIHFFDRIKKEKLIRHRFEQTGYTEIDAINTSNALVRLMGDLYTETERFVFELLQNADDQPEEGELVNVKLKALDENLLFLHTGKPFNEADVESISSIGDSTKKNDIEKTGYKGIGFKSVFSVTETVYINSGNFSFAFDKNSPLYPDGADMDKIPWQIKPIWEERYRLPKEIQIEDLFFLAPVGIALNVGSENIETYNRSISKILVNPQFTLFLRNVGEISFESKGRKTIFIKKQVTDSGIVQITSNSTSENWITKDYIIDHIPAETRNAIQNEKLVPEKLKEATKIKITFAAKIKDGAVCPIDDAVLYAYLPTKVKDFGFKFLVNADFLTTASREQIHFKNNWNRFLFTQIGSLLLDWIKSLKDYKGALGLLPLKFDDTDNLLSNDFHSALVQSILNTPFVKGHKGQLLAINNIMLDKSGLSEIIGKDLFCEIVNPDKSLPFDKKDEDAIKESSLFEDIEMLNPLPVLEKIKLNVPFHKWFLEANENLKKAFYDWLINIDTEKRRPTIESLVDNLPIYKFGESYCYKQRVEEDTNKFVVRSQHAVLKPIFEACGYECSDNIDESPIAVFYSENVIQSTISYILGHLTSCDSFPKWLSTSSDEELKTLIDWLVFHDKTNHKTISEFVESLPIVKFDDVSMTKLSASQDASRIIITNKIEPIKPILKKMGFLCSQNIETSPFAALVSQTKEIDLFNRIKEKTSTAPLNPTEKLELFKILTQFIGVTDTQLSQIILFANNTDTHRKWLSIMTGFTTDLPVWMHSYSINEKENFEELQPYLVKKDRIFEDIVKPNIEEIAKKIPLKDIYLAYKESWTLVFSKIIINKYGVSQPVLDLIEELQDGDSKKYFLQNVEKMDLNLNEVYTNTSFVYRVLAIAFQTLNDDELRILSGKIWIGERTLSSFMVSDEISFDYHEGKLIRLPLGKLLPSYADTGIVQKIKRSLSGFDSVSLDRLLALKPMSTKEVWLKVDKTNGLTPYSYLLGIYRTRKVNGWYNNWVTYVNLSEKDDMWISELLSIMYEQKVELHNDCFGYRLSNYFNGYISNEYVNSDETILESIENWADTSEKLSYIVGLGVKTERTNLVKCRKALVNNEVLSSSDIDNLKDYITSTINLLKSKEILPLQGDNQVSAMLALKPYSKYLYFSVDNEKLSANSIEYSLPEYVNWKQTNSMKIYMYDGLIPYQLKKTNDNDLLICSFERDDYYYDKSTKTLYINKSSEVRDTLYALVSNTSVPFTAEDWQLLFYDNLVSKAEVESREQEIEELKNELEEYKKAFGSLPSRIEETKHVEDKKDSKESEDNANREESKSNEDKESRKDEDPTIKKGDISQIPKTKQYEAQIEAQKFLMQEEPLWHFPPHYGEYKEDRTPYYFSTVDLEDAGGNSLSIVLKSYKKQDEPFKVNPEEWDYIFKESAYLLIYTGDDIKRIEKEDLVRNQSSISLSFSTENLDIEERIDAFCSTLHYFKELHFDFSSFNIAENAESIRKIFNRNKGIQNNNNTEEDL